MRKNSIILCFLVLLLVLTACTANKQEKESANTANGGKETASASIVPSESPQQSTEPNGAEPVFPREIESVGGKVTIEKQPVKVGLASWTLLEMLLPFDQLSAGITVPFAAKNSVLESEELKHYIDRFEQLEIVGESTKVNLEAMLAYAPDVIIAGSNTNQDVKEQLEQIAPTVWLNETNLDIRNQWPEVVTWFGTLLGQEERAKEVVDSFAAKQIEGKEKLAIRNGETVLFVQVREKAVYVMPPSTMKLFYDGLGLTAPDDLEDLPSYGQITLEGLQEINPDHLFLGYFNYTDKTLEAITDEWEQSEVWKSMKSVKNNHVYAINGELALGVGPIGQTYGLDKVIEAME